MKKFIKPVILIIVLGIVVTAAVFIGTKLASANSAGENITRAVENVVSEIIEEPEPEITVDYISEKLETLSELSTAKITYGCVCEMSAGSIPVINKKGFKMYYEATARAGIDISKITSEVTDTEVIIHLPKAEIQDCTINNETLEFLDVEKSLFNTLKPDDVALVLSDAQKDVYYQATTEQLLDMADENAQQLLTALLSDFIGDKNLSIIPGKRTDNAKVRAPYNSSDAESENYAEVEKKFKSAGFRNVRLKTIPDLNLLTAKVSEGKVETITIGGKDSFRKNNVFDINSEVIIEYHTKAN